jgi:hypothetical protein
MYFIGSLLGCGCAAGAAGDAIKAADDLHSQTSGQISPHRYTKDADTLPFSTGKPKFFGERFWPRSQVLPLPRPLA